MYIPHESQTPPTAVPRSAASPGTASKHSKTTPIAASKGRTSALSSGRADAFSSGHASVAKSDSSGRAAAPTSQQPAAALFSARTSIDEADSVSVSAPGKPAGSVSASLVSTNARIGISLSGGGIRAAIFHLGVLKWLAELGLLENLRHISTVSGASLAVGLIYAKSGGRFPDSASYLNETLPAIRAAVLRNDIQDRALMALTVRPWNWRRKVNLLAEAIERLWDVRGLVRDLPVDPLWSINCTTFETGKDFRITQKEMGDYKVGYIPYPTISIAKATAASAGFPVLIGPYRLATKECGWTKPEKRILHLWDGGVYDNLGLEALYKISDNGHLTGDLNYLIVCNASSASGYQERDFFSPVKNVRRLLSITMDQVNALRSRDVTDYLNRTGNGCYLKIGSGAGPDHSAKSSAAPNRGAKLSVGPGRSASASRDGKFSTGSDRPTTRTSSDGSPAARTAGLSDSTASADHLSPQQIARVKHYPTTLSSPTPDDFDLILRHGYEVARDKIFTLSKDSFSRFVVY